MPIETLPLSAASSAKERGAPRLHLRLTPYRSLSPQGFVWFIGVTAAMISVPLFSILGTVAFYVLLPFLIAAIWGIWAALKRSWRDMDRQEIVMIWDDLIRVEHQTDRTSQNWEANPYWVRATIHPRGGPVENYLTMIGNGVRQIELGAFLTAEERLNLKQILDRELRPSPAL